MTRLTESDLQRGVIDLAHALGYRVAHFRPAMTARGWRTPVQGDGAGFPDLVLVRAGDSRILAVELKADGRRPTPAQEQWLDELAACGVPSRVWTPADYPDRIVEALR